jgi:hypothetical protein
MNEVDWRSVLLDLLNTTPMVAVGQSVDLLEGDEARGWLQEHGAGDGVSADDARRVRDDLQRVVWGRADPGVLSGYLAEVRRVPRIDARGLDWSLEADWPARVVLAWGELQREIPGRLRACANEECRMFLLDRTRGGTAKWCSMSGCGNRLKARRHYHRSTRQAGD